MQHGCEALHGAARLGAVLMGYEVLGVASKTHLQSFVLAGGAASLFHPDINRRTEFGQAKNCTDVTTAKTGFSLLQPFFPCVHIILTR